MTSYDEIFQQFMEINRTDPINIPSDDMGKYNMIRSAVRHYNNRMDDDVECNDEAESVDRDLSNDELLIIAHYIKYTFLENSLIYESTLLNPFQGDIGIKNVRDQLNAKRELIKIEKETIEELILNQSEDYL